jgi:LysM repeat protein
MDISRLINAYRGENGLYQYVYNTTLEAVAQKHTDYQVSIELSTHEGEGGSTSKDRVMASGYGEGESIFADEIIYSGGFATPEAALEWWKNSSIHNGIMLSDKYHEFGVGVRITDDKKYYTVNFASIEGVTSPGVGTAPVQSELAEASPVMVAAPNQDGLVVHVVEAGQTIQAIADAYQVSVESLLVQNGLASGAVLTAGQTLVIKPSEDESLTAGVEAPPVPELFAADDSAPAMGEISTTGTQPAIPEGYVLVPNLLLTVLVVVAIVASAGVTFFAFLRFRKSERRNR